jgi:cobyrinic acid a,c-diamide synthase
VTDAIEAIGLRVVGSIPRDSSVVLPERHLGLVQAEETEGLEAILEAMANLVAQHVDLDEVKLLARSSCSTIEHSTIALEPPGQRIALARDAAFSFMYPHLLAGWRNAGAEIIPFSPLADEGPREDCDVCWLPGGYPELHAGVLAAASSFKWGLKAFAETRPVHGECGGYMALGETLEDADGVTHEMIGLLSVRTSFAKRKMQLGYRDVTLSADTVLGNSGRRLRGHEFHYATILDKGGDEPLVSATDAYGASPEPAGSRRGNVTGSFFHVIAASD